VNSSWRLFIDALFVVAAVVGERREKEVGNDNGNGKDALVTVVEYSELQYMVAQGQQLRNNQPIFYIHPYHG